MGRVIEGLNNHDRIQAWSYADELLHNAPQTQKFFDPNISLGEIKNRQTQKNEAREAGKSLQAGETSKYFERSNVTTIKHNLTPEFRHYFEFALKTHNVPNVKHALSFKIMKEYVSFREQQVYDREIQPNTFKEYMSRLRIMCSMSTATEGFPNVNVDKLTAQATERVKEYVKAQENTNNPVVTAKHSIYAIQAFNKLDNGEDKKIIENIYNEKCKLSMQMVEKYMFRNENVSTVYLGYEWVREGKGFKRVPTDEYKIALVSKGNQHHTITIDKELFDKMKQFANKKGVFHVSKRTLQDNVKKAAEKLGLKSTVHVQRAISTKKLYAKLRRQGYSEEDAKRIVSRKLFHGRLDITEYYLNS